MNHHETPKNYESWDHFVQVVKDDLGIDLNSGEHGTLILIPETSGELKRCDTHGTGEVCSKQGECLCQ